jgi:hypothetical protein
LAFSGGVKRSPYEIELARWEVVSRIFFSFPDMFDARQSAPADNGVLYGLE